MRVRPESGSELGRGDAQLTGIGPSVEAPALAVIMGFGQHLNPPST
jgi:hypothetical protein